MSLNKGVLFFFLCFLLNACQEEKKSSLPPGVKPFELDGASEQVLLAFDNGSHKLSVFTDENSKQKIAEIEFHPNGQPKIHKRFENDSLNGESWCYYEDGKPWSLNTFKNGINDGPYQTWHENGQLYINGSYKNGKEEGEWFIYYPSGNLNTRGMYKDGAKVGIWSSYNLEGTMRREQDFSKPIE